MNNFAGIISFHPTTNGADYVQTLRHRFPKRTAAMNIIGSLQMKAMGHFDPSSLNSELPNRVLYMDGEIFNMAEIAALVDSTVNTGINNATIIHKLILKNGIEGAAKLNGQFLIIYIDKHAGAVHLLTDHSGVQQVFYYEGQDFFLFASDIKFLLAHPECPAEIDWESSLRRPYPHTVLSNYRNYGTWFKNIHLLPEATDCSIHYDDKKIVKRKFWNGLYDYTPPSANDKRTAADVMEEYMALLDDAVKIRTNDSEKAFSFLSGGLDSSAICALAAKYKPLDSFSIINQTTVIEDTTSACNSLSRDLSFNNSQFLIPYHELTFNKQRWKQRVWRTESPVNHTDALTKNLLHYAIGQKHPSVPYVLTGTGSDQMNGGLVRWVANEEENEQLSSDAFFKRIKEAEAYNYITHDDEASWRIRKLLTLDYHASVSGQKYQDNYWMYYAQSALHGETYSLLWDEVRAASAHGRSVRFPFLDHRFAQFIASVPESLHKELFYDKQILRTPSQKILPDYITAKNKVPAYMPGYDFRSSLFDFLTSGTDSILEEAFGSLGDPHPVVDKPELWARVQVMKLRPEPYEWQELIHVINLGLLEQLAGKTEADLDFEKDLQVPEQINFDDPAVTKIVLQRRLGVKTDEDILAMSLKYEEECSLMQDYRTGNYFLARQNTLAYELDNEYKDWIALLRAIDGVKSTKQIVDELKLDIESFRDFFKLALKERILCLGAVAATSKTEPQLV